LNNLFSHEPGKNNCNHSCEALLQYIQATSEAMAQVGLKCLERKVQYDYKQSEYIKLEQENYYIEVHHPKADETAKIMIEEMQQYMIYAKTNNFDLPSHFEDHTADLLRQLIEMLDIDINKIDNIDEEYNLLKLKNAMIKRFGIQILLENA
jgi:hypothetical protein